MPFPRLYLISQDLEDKPHIAIAQQLAPHLRAKALFQFRTKKPQTFGELVAQSKSIKAVCQTNGLPLIVNDNVYAALESGADGVHLGKEDIHPRVARTILGPSFLIGCTANTFDDIRRAADAGADYIGLGPYRYTQTKAKLSPLLGLQGYAQIMEKCRQYNLNIPVFAIGGIQYADLEALLQTGVYGVCAAAAINLAEKPEAEAGKWLNLLEF